MMNSGLAFDIGANTGQDTAALLARGLRVVAVEANPKLCANMRARFADAIGDGRLVIIDKAISGRKTVTFYVNSADSGWGTTSASYAGRGAAMAGKLEQIEVETTTLTEIIRAHGSPRYLKIDIEGADILCLLGLFDTDAPPFISIEVRDRSTTSSLPSTSCAGLVTPGFRSSIRRKFPSNVTPHWRSSAAIVVCSATSCPRAHGWDLPAPGRSSRQGSPWSTLFSAMSLSFRGLGPGKRNI